VRVLSYSDRLAKAKTYEQKKLNALFQEYLKTLDNESNEDHYTTDRNIATSVFFSFMKWVIEERKL
jgi:hypothetical protein